MNTSITELRDAALTALSHHENLPFAVISSVHDQKLLNVPVMKPLLIFVCGGHKVLGDGFANCQPGDFVFLSYTQNVDMRNISQTGSGYFALLVEFEFSDFEVFQQRTKKRGHYFSGKTTDELALLLRQFIDSTPKLPEALWKTRRQEFLLYLYHLGYVDVASVSAPSGVSQRVEQIITDNLSEDFSAESTATLLAMSDSTMRRKLSSEGTSFQAVKDRVKLAHGLNLIQTTNMPIGRVAQCCGYQSQSRFTDKFKSLYSCTPSELRKTRFPG